ncbi:MAG: hypothetical protein KKH51_15905 [Actinobacteria bacterium]|nr:hypothetical protein [Actinomycetota bacterium]
MPVDELVWSFASAFSPVSIGSDCPSTHTRLSVGALRIHLEPTMARASPVESALGGDATSLVPPTNFSVVASNRRIAFSLLEYSTTCPSSEIATAVAEYVGAFSPSATTTSPNGFTGIATSGAVPLSSSTERNTDPVSVR